MPDFNGRIIITKCVSMHVLIFIIGAKCIHSITQWPSLSHDIKKN